MSKVLNCYYAFVNWYGAQEIVLMLQSMNILYQLNENYNAKRLNLKKKHIIGMLQVIEAWNV